MTSRYYPVTGALLTATLLLAGCGAGEDSASRTAGPQPYDEEYPAIGYAAGEPGGRAGRFAAALESGDLALDFNVERGYLDATLEALEIDASSQALVFSKTALQSRHIDPTKPRAIYFNDDTYVAWAKGAPAFEIANFDPELGPVFYGLANVAGGEPAPARELARCLRCHDSFSMSGGGVPRFIIGSGYIRTDGELVSHEGWILTDQSTPLRSRWGGWYVTGRHGRQVHLGNFVVQHAEDLQNLEELRVGNVDELSTLFDSTSYLTAQSDIVALMVLEHQVEVQNAISRLRFETVGRLAEEGGDVDDARLAALIEPLVSAMLMLDEAPLTDVISGGSGFREHFESLGPFDTAGRSLRQFDLETRLFRFPLSYLIYSEAFNALPEKVRSAVHDRITAILAATPVDDGFTALTTSDRVAILGVLAGTLPDESGP